MDKGAYLFEVILIYDLLTLTSRRLRVKASDANIVYRFMSQVILIPNLLRLGQQHTNIQGFKHEYFQSFSRAMNDVFKKHLGRAYTKETRIAWNKISSLIINTVEQGYREGQVY